MRKIAAIIISSIMILWALISTLIAVDNSIKLLDAEHRYLKKAVKVDHFERRDERFHRMHKRKEARIMENLNFTSADERNLIWEHIKTLSEEAKKEHTVEELVKLTGAICNTLLALQNVC